MPHEESGGVELKGLDNCSEPYVTCKDDSSCQNGSQKGEVDALLQTSHELGAAPSSTISIVISHPEDIPRQKTVISKIIASDGDEKMASAGVAKKDALSSESYQELCRICQQETEEPLIDLGCKCRGELAKAHQSCIGLWFHTRGSNECEICQQAAVNVPFSERQPNTNYWVWRVDPANGGHPEHQRGFLSPLWLAFGILIGGLLLDVLISVTFGVSALPVNIIIGILIVLGVGTALRLTLGCCHHYGAQRNLQRAEATADPSYYPAGRTWGTWFQML